MKFVVLGFNHKTTPLKEREGWSVSSSQVPIFLKGFLKIPHVLGIVYLATCNRIEVYAAIQEDFSPSSLMAYWKDFLNLKQDEVEPAYFYRDGKALDHLLRVAIGLDSLALGETQVLGQVKQAYSKSLELKVTNPFINFAFQQAFRIAKEIRTETGIAKHPTSIGTVALLLVEQIFGEFKNLSALVIGLGEFGSQTAELLRKRGVKKLIVTNRTASLADGFAKREGIEVYPFDKMEGILPIVDLVITSTSSEMPILSKKVFSKSCFLARENPLILIDLGVPRDIEPEVADIANIYLYNIDDLKTIADKNLAFRRKEALLAEEKIQQALTTFEKDWERRSARFQFYPVHG